MSNPVAQVLRNAADLLDAPGRWTQGNYAVNATGEGVDYDGDEACSFCVMGAIARVGKGHPFDVLRKVDNALRERTPDRRIALWNDDPKRKQSEVVALLRQVAEEIDPDE